MRCWQEGGDGGRTDGKGKELNDLMTALLPKLNLPKASTADSETWYQLYASTR
ncbi:MAG: hypothetical protein ACLS29_01620 [Prevotellamassilia sp.]